VWNETFEFNTNSNELEVTVKDHDLGLDDTIGSCVISANEFPNMSGEARRVKKPIQKGGEITGMIELKIAKK